MKFTFLTLYPELINAYLTTSIAARVGSSKVAQYEVINIRKYSKDNYQTVDGRPYGGGDGMILMLEPIYLALKEILSANDFESLLNGSGLTDTAIILLSPKGKIWKQDIANEFKNKFKYIIYIIPHFEGIDERVAEHLCTHVISIGDYILTGGELPSLAITDSIIRLLPGALGNDHSSVDESFSNNLLEYPQYTRPSKFEMDDQVWEVPEVLLSGNHENIRLWRKQKSIEITTSLRPDL